MFVRRTVPLAFPRLRRVRGRRRAVAGVAALVLLVGCGAGRDAGVAFENAWIRAPAPGATVAAGYCDIVNGGTEDIVIVGFAGAERVEMHETIEQEGRMGMRPLPRLAVAAGSTVALAPGGKHLMVFGLDGGKDRTTLQARFEDGRIREVTFAVRPAAPPG